MTTEGRRRRRRREQKGLLTLKREVGRRRRKRRRVVGYLWGIGEVCGVGSVRPSIGVYRERRGDKFPLSFLRGGMRGGNDP